jgi:hypothetical protein
VYDVGSLLDLGMKNLVVSKKKKKLYVWSCYKGKIVLLDHVWVLSPNCGKACFQVRNWV